MKKLKKLQINHAKLMKNEELLVVRGGYFGGVLVCLGGEFGSCSYYVPGCEGAAESYCPACPGGWTHAICVGE